MKCFFFKEKFKTKRGSRSAPDLQSQNKSDSSAVKRGTKSLNSLQSPRSIPELYKEKEHNLRVFQYEELREATNGFNRLLKIGEGGFGSVYKGTISPPNGRGDPMVVAIKKLNTKGLQSILLEKVKTVQGTIPKSLVQTSKKTKKVIKISKGAI